MIFTVTLNPALDKTILVNKLNYKSILKANKTIENCGGKGFNVSRSLKVLGIESTAIGFVGGQEGEKIEEELQQNGISTNLVHIENNTRVNYILAEEKGENYIKVNEKGPAISPLELGLLLSEVKRLIKPADLWVLSGSIPNGLYASIYAELIKLIHENKGTAFLDSSGSPLLSAISASPDLIKPNLEEFEELMSTKLDSLERMQTNLNKLHERNLNTIALSLGSKGLLLSNYNATVFAPAPLVEIRNSTGAGDALLSGIIWAMLQDFPFVEIAAWGVAAGTASAMKEGVEFSTLSEIMPLYNEIIKNTLLL